MKVGVLHASKHGATRGIVELIAQTLREEGIDAEAQAVTSASDPEGWDAVILGSAIYYGAWLEEASAFARRHRDHLSRIPLRPFSSGARQ